LSPSHPQAIPSTRWANPGAPGLVFYQAWITRVGNGLGHPPKQLGFGRHFTQQQRSRIGGDFAAIEIGRQPLSFEGCKSDRRRMTFCPHGPASLLELELW